jgi:ComF family protein
MKQLLLPLTDLLNLFYPHLCLACERNAPAYGEHICVPCQATLPLANFHHKAENPFAERFWGRAPIEAAASLYLFRKGSRVQHLLHQLKYRGKKEVGVLLGRQFGRQLGNSELFKQPDLIVPVPLHPRKQRLRGYNQSELFAQGLSQGLGIPVVKDGLMRTVHAGSQTQKSREERVEKIKDCFEVKRPGQLSGKHILLADDVMTTGATLEVCAGCLLKLPGTKVSLATIAMAVKG